MHQEVTDEIVMIDDDDIKIWGVMMEGPTGPFLNVHVKVINYSLSVHKRAKKVINQWDKRLLELGITEVYSVVKPEDNNYSKHFGLKFMGAYEVDNQPMEVYKWVSKQQPM